MVHFSICSVTRYMGIYPSGHQVPCARYSGDDAGVDNVRLRRELRMKGGAAARSEVRAFGGQA